MLGIGVNALGDFYGNALQAASDGGHIEIVKLLLAQGADVNAQGGESRHPDKYRQPCALLLELRSAYKSCRF
jgi:ankyrin repeat protein